MNKVIIKRCVRCNKKDYLQLPNFPTPQEAAHIRKLYNPTMFNYPEFIICNDCYKNKE